MIVVLWILAAVIVGLLGRHRSLGFWGCFVISLLIGPILPTLILLLTLPVRRRQPAR